MDPDDEVRKQLDAVVGERFAPPRRALTTLARWVAAAILAVAAAALVMGTLDRYMTQAERAPAPPKPVTIQIVPAR